MSEEVETKDSLGDRMKLYESEYDIAAPRDHYVLLRVDGRSFSKYTASFEKPFDERIEQAMNAAAIALCKEFNASLVYTQSDEITVVIPPKWSEKAGVYHDHEFLGRVQKLVTVAASVAAVAFDRSLQHSKPPAFDCRIMSVNESEAANALYWRVIDCERNATSSLYRYTFGHKKMQNKSCSVMRSELGDTWENLDPDRKNGRFIKRALIPTDHPDRPYVAETIVLSPSWINGKRPVHKELVQLISQKKVVSPFPMIWSYTEPCDE